MWYAHGSVPLELVVAEKLFDGLITSSRHGLRINSKKVKTIGQAIDVSRFEFSNVKNEDTTSVHFCTVGRLSRSKNIDLIIKSFSRFSRDLDIDARLAIIGSPLCNDGTRYRDELILLSKEQRMQHKIDFIDEVPNTMLTDELKKYSHFINLSTTGSMDKAILEAMSMGLITITNNIAFLEDMRSYSSELLESFIDSDDEKVIADKMLSISKWSVNKRRMHRSIQRDYVRDCHSIDTLPDRLFKAIEECEREKAIQNSKTK